MTTSARLQAVWDARDVAFCRLGVASDREAAARRALASALAAVRKQAKVRLVVVADACGYSASFVQQFERGGRWSEGLAFRYWDWAMMLVKHPDWRDEHHEAETCPVGDSNCLSREGECHDACDPAR